jgi:hypothetical protein
MSEGVVPRNATVPTGRLWVASCQESGSTRPRITQRDFLKMKDEDLSKELDSLV